MDKSFKEMIYFFLICVAISIVIDIIFPTPFDPNPLGAINQFNLPY